MTAPDPGAEDLLSLVRRQARRFGDKPFMSFGDGGAMSFSGFDRRLAGFRAHLRREGVRPGDRVALMLQNSLFYPVAWLGVVTSGAIAVPVNKRLGEVDAGYIIEHSGASAVIADETTVPVARKGAPDAVPVAVVARSGDAMVEFESGPDGDDPVELHVGSLANIQYTSGTTGFPKGCLLTHRFWQRMGAAAVEALSLTESDTLLTSQAHSYIDPQWNVIAALRSGCHLVLLDGFHPATFMRDVARFGVTVFYCLGVMPTLLLKQPPGPHDTDNALQRVYCSAIPIEHHAAIERRWGVPWTELFGMTETGVNLAVPAEAHDRLVGSGSIGLPLWHNEAAVVDDTDRELGPGMVGELVLRGLGFMEGYHEDPDATSDFFRNGWAHTGDLVERDADGFIYYRGRRKEMIRRGGENISPVEIEAALSTHPEVVECAVAPVPDADLGEEIKAYVVLREGAPSDPRALADHVRARLAGFKVPRYWEARRALPHTPSEKVAKAELEAGRRSFLEGTTDLRAG